jgi:hypothetical protein
MLVDIQMAKAQTAYKRDQLSRSFNSARRPRKTRLNRLRRSWLRVRKPSMA